MAREIISLLEGNPNPTKTQSEFEATLNDIESASALLVPCRNFVFPEFQIVRSHLQTTREISVKQLFSEKGLPENNLRLIYEERNGKFTGLFTPNGKQELADILGKTLIFAHQPHSEPVIDLETAEVFVPTVKA